MAEVWPFFPYRGSTETLSASTVVHYLRDADMRWSLRPVREIFGYRYGMALLEFQKARAIFRENILGSWYVPVWSEATQKVAVLGSDTSISCDTSADYRIGGKAIVWSSCDVWSLVTVQSVGPTGITLTAPVGTNHPSAFVMPVRECFCRNGMSFTENTENYTNFDLTFECSDLSDILLTRDRMQIAIAIDRSLVMDEVVLDDATRMDIAKMNVISFLTYLESTGREHDVHIVAWSSTADTLTIDNASGTDWDDLRAFVEGITTSGLRDATQAVTGASTFFDGTERRLMFVLTSDSMTNVASAAATLAGISDLEVYGMILELPLTTDIDQLDNQGGASVLSDTSVQVRDLMVLACLGIPQWGGAPYINCAKRTVRPLAGSMNRVSVAIDSGMGPVVLVPTRTFVDETNEVVLVPQNMVERRLVKQVLHFLCGQDRPFWIPDFRLRIISSTTTTVVVPPVRKSHLDWVGESILVGGKKTTVISAALSGLNHELTFTTVAPASAPTGDMWSLRRLRQVSDEINLDHTRGRHAYTTMIGVTA